MRLLQGDMWSAFDQADLFLITTNGTLTRDGKLVMGAVVAKQARDRFPGQGAALGKAVEQAGERYGLPVSPRWPVAKLGAFQTKAHLRERSSLELIAFATRTLLVWCEEHPTADVYSTCQASL